LDDSLEERQVEEAIAALQMRATFEKYIKAKTGLNKLSRPQLIQEHEVLVKRAADERAKNPNFHAVSEHDGLTWQRSQQQVAPFLCTFKPCPFLQEQF
jgi:U11/U12 small nuclear ribonucleoprotein SNRNP48